MYWNYLPRHSVYIAVLCTVLLSCFTIDVKAKDCLGQDQCSCAFEDGTKVMLNSLGNSDGTPRFKDVEASDGSKYSYNPCFPFSEGSGESCAQAAACELTKLGNEVLIGAAQSAEFTYDGGSVIVGYTAGHGILTSTQVTLKCDPHACEPKIVANGNQGLQQYDLTLTTVCACPGGCNENGPISCSSGGLVGGLSTGGLILIVFFTFLFIYVVGGTAFMAFGRKARGKEVIPNVSFWSSLPGLIKDGFLFTIRPCRRGAGYSSS